METTSEFEQESVATSFWQRDKAAIKGLFVGVLILLMLIPQSFISGLVAERQLRQQQVVKEVSNKWAGKQKLTGPILAIPFAVVLLADGTKDANTKKMAYILPDKLYIDGKIIPQEKHRSLYNVTLYNAGVQLKGDFAPIQLNALGLKPEEMYWDEARLIVDIADTRGLEEEVGAQWNGEQKRFESGATDAPFSKGLSFPVAIKENTPYQFDINLKLKGSEQLYFTPIGKTTAVKMTSTWDSPIFDGQYLPNTQNKASKNGFTAQWKILALSRNYPHYWKGVTYDLNSSAFGVRLRQGTDSYVKTERSVKYALLFIGLSFAVFFFLEIIQKKQIHPLQYLLVGFALIVFYTLLLSISEYTGFNAAYCVAAIATMGLIGMYIASIFSVTKTVLLFTGALGGLYTYIFVIIQLEDFALLFGSLGLFVILATLMYGSRKVDWYGLNNSKKTLVA